MKKIVVKLIAAGVLLLCAAPGSVFAQKGKTGSGKEMQTIVITRNGNTDEKTVIEIKGDKVTVNGKDAKDNKDVHVNVSTVKGLRGNAMRFYNTSPGASGWGFNMNEGNLSLFNADSSRAMLGITTIDKENGAAIASVNENSAADKAGLKKGDVLLKIGKEKVSNAADVTEAVRSHKPSEKVDITYKRDGKEQKTTATLQAWEGIVFGDVNIPNIEMNMAPMMESLNKMRFSRGANGLAFTGRPQLGLSIQDTENGNGVKVLAVDDDSPAEKAGLKEGDVIVAVDDVSVKSTDDITRTLRENRNKYVFSFKVQRNGSTQTLEVKFPKKLKQVDL